MLRVFALPLALLLSQSAVHAALAEEQQVDLVPMSGAIEDFETSEGAQSGGPIPLEHFAVREAVTQVEVSPNGRYLALMKIASREGNPVIEIYETADLNKEPRRLAADPMEFISLTWVSDDNLFINARQKVRNRIEGFNRGIYEFVSVNYTISERDFEELDENTALVNILPKDPDHILISQSTTDLSLLGDDPFAAFRPRAYYKLNLKTQSKELVLKGNNRVATAIFDPMGNPRFAQGYDASTREFVYYGRSPGETTWREVLRTDSYDTSTAFFFQVQAFDPAEPDIAYALATNGHDKVGLWELNLETGEFGEVLYRRGDADVISIVPHSDVFQRPGEPAGLVHYGDGVQFVWFDPEEEALYEGLKAAIPNAFRPQVTTRSRDSRVMTVFNQGPKDAGSYYLLKDGQLRYIGGHYPHIKPESLSDVRFIRYKARDGLEIPGYLTIPNAGEAPYPLVVVPHGGPYVSEAIVYDEWSQMLANNGYMVLQPQYRGSLGYGVNHLMSSVSQHGLAMQDDKDDGAMYLVEQGLADPDRIAMFGWSYGGYAAAVAASRTPQVYQCVIAGAPVTDGTFQLNYYRDTLLPATEQWELQRRQGVNPMDEVAKINVPVLLIHGRQDQRVPYPHATRWANAMESAGKEHKFVTLEGADHFSNTLFYNHQLTLYRALTTFLKNDCGPGGL